MKKKRSEEIEEEINFRDNNEEWLNTWRENDTNKYHWFHGGERTIMFAKLQECLMWEEGFAKLKSNK